MPPKATLAPGHVPPGDSNDMCPVCRTNRYFNKDLRFLINPDCYHPMCSNCVDRIFTDAPAQCPYAGCHKTLRKKGFRQPFFDDLSIEREWDIRKRVASVFNKTQDDFETLRDYNEYLNQVEDLTFDLVFSPDEKRRAKAERTLKEYEEDHKAEIEMSRLAGKAADEATKKRIAAEQAAARERRREAALQAEEERIRRLQEREEALDELAAAPEGLAGKVMLKRREKKPMPNPDRDIPMRDNTSSAVPSDDANTSSAKPFFAGLKQKPKPAKAEGPYDVFAGGDFVPDRYKLQKQVPKPPYKKDVARDPHYTTGGYDVRDYYVQAMYEAFAGLGVFVDDEKEMSGRLGLDSAEVASMAAGLAAAESRRLPLQTVEMSD